MELSFAGIYVICHATFQEPICKISSEKFRPDKTLMKTFILCYCVGICCTIHSLHAALLMIDHLILLYDSCKVAVSCYLCDSKKSRVFKHLASLRCQYSYYHFLMWLLRLNRITSVKIKCLCGNYFQ
jgi:hypothetical protein